MKRPAFITLLAAFQIIGAVGCLVGAIGLAVIGNTPDALLLAVVGIVQMLCGAGLLSLQSYGRTLQQVMAVMGLLAVPFGTIVSILILIYLQKPGVKTLFSGKPASELTPEELAEVDAASKTPVAMLVVVVALVVLLVVFVAGIIAAIALPSLLKARTSANELSAMASLRAIASAEQVYASSCAGGGYAVTLEDLGRPAKGTDVGFIGPDLAVDGVVKFGYRFSLARNAAAGTADVGTADATCNGSARAPASAFFASAEPEAPGVTGVLYFATDSSGLIYQSVSPIANPIVASAQVTPIR